MSHEPLLVVGLSMIAFAVFYRIGGWLRARRRCRRCLLPGRDCYCMGGPR